MRTTKLFKSFFESEKSGGIVLIITTLVSLMLANSDFSSTYINFWHTTVGNHSIEHWVNDGLMTIFFLLIGLELEREVYIGELSSLKNAMLPLVAAIGGMIVPALFYSFLNFGTDTKSGFGIPMATDIAFALGILSLLGNKVPTSLKVFLTALAVIDDLGAILIIAFFYTNELNINSLFISLGIFTLLLIFNRLKVRNLIPYLIGGVFMWYFMLNSGVHATITGVLLAFALPFGNGNKKSTSYLLQKALHFPVAFVILPVFALANTAIIIDANWHHALSKNYTLGIALGLLLGKPVGIYLTTFLATKLKIASLPTDLNWKIIIGTGFLAGIGFTMSIFITLLAFNDSEHITNSKIMILVSSLFAGITGLLFLKSTLNKEVIEEI